ncbi:hypothetical protein [Candidatus Thiosymbion oneisti]|uniref:hypothetical protein n=1 Tax=Candidatus Thiosymbion oneisti TaxID=589554 RepID=UPI001FB0E0C4|nr:hypothetical protein [Candidatus Thiosymbion oneisti]
MQQWPACLAVDRHKGHKAVRSVICRWFALQIFAVSHTPYLEQISASARIIARELNHYQLKLVGWATKVALGGLNRRLKIIHLEDGGLYLDPPSAD